MNGVDRVNQLLRTNLTKKKRPTMIMFRRALDSNGLNAYGLFIALHSPGTPWIYLLIY